MNKGHDPHDPYVELREGVRYVRGGRVPLESLVWLWRDGQSAEEIREAYPTLRLAEVYGALAYYLDHQAEVDQELAEGLARFEAQRAAAEATDPARYTALRQRFAAARAQQSAS
ncbi:MAG TPA: DUF433 domain-containing protein [Ktedonobacterales bacterium]|nr:DUF433 domain-containing protein [Ktedonobacterales bacterium]